MTPPRPGLLLVIAALAYGSPALAQRGEAYVVQQPAPTTPLTGIPGLFDTNTVPRHGVAVSFPSTSLDYGLTDRLSVGTYLAATVPAFWRAPGLALKARYRMHSDGRLTSVVDVVGGAAFWRGDEPGHAFLAMIGVNTSYQLSPRQSLTLSLLGGRFSDTIDDVASDLSGAAVGLGYQASLTRFLAFQLAALNVPIFAADGESDDSVVSVRLHDDLRSLADRTFVRGVLSFRLGGWLLEPGAIVGPGLLRNPLPWLSVSKVW
jgi:hypothetical protein